MSRESSTVPVCASQVNRRAREKERQRKKKKKKRDGVKDRRSPLSLSAGSAVWDNAAPQKVTIANVLQR